MPHSRNRIPRGVSHIEEGMAGVLLSFQAAQGLQFPEPQE